MGRRPVTGGRRRLRRQCPDRSGSHLPRTAAEWPQRQQLARFDSPDPSPQRLPASRCGRADHSPWADSLPYVPRRQPIAPKQRQRPYNRHARKQPVPQHLGRRHDHHCPAAPAPKSPLPKRDLLRRPAHFRWPSLLPLPQPVAHHRQRLPRALARRPTDPAPRRSHRRDRRNTTCPKLDTQPRMYQSLDAHSFRARGEEGPSKLTPRRFYFVCLPPRAALCLLCAAITLGLLVRPTSRP
jgi:hypothetical protein